MPSSKSEPNSPERGGGDQSSPLSIRLPGFARYNLWPKPKKSSPVEPTTPYTTGPSSGQQRSPTSLSDHAVPQPKRLQKFYRGGNLANRRKISVPELREKPAMESFDQLTPLEPLEPLVDSPTIPGRPPLRSISSHMCLSQHERSKSFPEEERPIFHDHIVSLVAPQPVQPPESPVLSPIQPWPLPASPPTYTPFSAAFNPTRPLSPILSPPEGTTPTPGSPVLPDFQTPPREAPLPPRVPPKPSGIIIAAPVTPPPRKESLKPRPSLPVLNPDATEITKYSNQSVRSNSPPSPRRDRSNSPKLGTTPEKPSTSIMDRGRPLPRTKSSSSLRTVDKEKDDYLEYATLPTGLKPIEAIVMLPPSEKESLAKQASTQAERFEILGSDQVTTLSKELRGLDERCEYLRKTYRSLRMGRQKLHNRLLSYLKSEALSFSKDRLLKQEEALVELDRAIDDWITKLDRAENRRLRVRQKLLEHVAAAMMLSVNGTKRGTMEPTPPGSREGFNHSSASSIKSKDRADVESIKIYADTQVLNLFSDIEQAIGRMCEAAC